MEEMHYGKSRTEWAVDEGSQLETIDASSSSGDELDAVGYATRRSFSGEPVQVSIGYNHKEKRLQELERISGVGERKAKALYREGYESINNIRWASQSELSDIDEIGKALAARIKADVGRVGICADEIVDELEEDPSPSFLDENTLMVNIYE